MKNRFLAARRAASLHLSLSAAMAAAVATLIFFVWFPWPYTELAGGKELFLLAFFVDMVCGPILTLVVYDPNKKRGELIRDLCVIGVLQVLALIYGVHAISQARPIHLVFEVDRLRVVTAAEIEPADLLSATEEFRQLPWLGPTLASVRDPRNAAEYLRGVELSLAGQEPSLRPGWWQRYSKAFPQILKVAKPISLLAARGPKVAHDTQVILRDNALTAQQAMWLPLTSARAMDWVVILRRSDANPIGFIHFDGFLN